MATAGLQQLLDSFAQRLSVVEGTLGLSAGGSSGSSSSASGYGASASEATAPFVSAYDDYCATNLTPFVEACKTLGEAAAQGGEIVQKAWAAQRNFLVMASQCKKPSQQDLMAQLKPVQECIAEAGSLDTRGKWGNHAKTIQEGLGCLSWVAVAPPAGLPKDVVESAVGGQDYWANKIRVEFKKTSPEQVAFCDTFKALLNGLVEYVVAHHKTGVSWNHQGKDVSSYPGGSAAPAPAPAPAAAAPAASAPAGGKPAGGGLGNVFGELSKGLDVTKGLKKVTKDQQTWREEYKGDGKPAPAPAPAPKPAAKTVDAPKGPPVMEFQRAGLKWLVENQGADQGVVTVDCNDIKHQVYIYGCVGATIDIRGKFKGVAIDGCRKTKVLLDDAISSVEAVNCQRMQVQVRGKVPSIAIDKTDGFLCYLSAEGMAETTFTTSKSSEMNVSFPKPGATDGELMEMPIPEQFVHTVKVVGETPSITSSVSELYSH